MLLEPQVNRLGWFHPVSDAKKTIISFSFFFSLVIWEGFFWSINQVKNFPHPCFYFLETELNSLLHLLSWTSEHLNFLQPSLICQKHLFLFCCCFNSWDTYWFFSGISPSLSSCLFLSSISIYFPLFLPSLFSKHWISEDICPFIIPLQFSFIWNR